jgi:hypothetical protein
MTKWSIKTLSNHLDGRACLAESGLSLLSAWKVAEVVT